MTPAIHQSSDRYGLLDGAARAVDGHDLVAAEAGEERDPAVEQLRAPHLAVDVQGLACLAARALHNGRLADGGRVEARHRHVAALPLQDGNGLRD